jgi:hypothetical protein
MNEIDELFVWFCDKRYMSKRVARAAFAVVLRQYGFST